MNPHATLWYRLVKKHDEVWSNRQRLPFKVRMAVCQKLWEASIKTLLPKESKGETWNKH